MNILTEILSSNIRAEIFRQLFGTITEELHMREIKRGIENKSHYVRDVIFDENKSKVRTKSGLRVMATLRNFAISILRIIGYSNIAKALRDMMAKPHMAL